MKQLPFINPDERVFVEFFIGLILLVGIYIFFSQSGFLDIFSGFQTGKSVFLPLFTGLAAGFSTCMAMVGGIIFAISAQWNKQHAEASRIYRFAPHLWLNL